MISGNCYLGCEALTLVRLRRAISALHLHADLHVLTLSKHGLTVTDFRFWPKLADHYSRTGRPSIDPDRLVRMLIVGYCYGIRSERRLCEEVADRLTFRWFCRLGLDDKVPDPSTFSKNRHGRFRAVAGPYQKQAPAVPT